MSEQNDFIHIESRLTQYANGIREGDAIILSVRVKYQGVPFKNEKPRTLTLGARGSTGTADEHAYSFDGDCYTYGNPKCNPTTGGRRSGVAVSYERDFLIGTSGYDHGRIVKLGDDKDVPFDQVKLEAGVTYLIRTISWPEEDVVTKMHVDAISKGTSVTITSEKLVYVPETELKKIVDQTDDFTKNYEQPLSTGDVTLYNRSVTNNYFYASFNFFFSTSGNMFITHNSWDLMFEGDARHPQFSVPHTGSGIGQVIDLGTKDIAQVDANNFPDPDTYNRSKRPFVTKGHTYAIYHYEGGRNDFGIKSNDELTWGAVQVIDVDKDAKWVQLKFRRVKISGPDHFQNWISLAIPTDIVKTTLDTSSADTATFYPFIMKRADQGRHSDEKFSIYWNANLPVLDIDSRPYGNDRGFTKLPSGTVFGSVTSADVEALRGKFNRGSELAVGDIVAANLENYYDLTVAVLRIEAISPGKSVDFSIRYLKRAKAPYFEDLE